MFKKVIIGFFCFLILAVVGVGTYLYTLNWNKHKATVAKRLSEITGLNASIEGDLSIKLIPAPKFSAGIVNFSKPGTRDPLITVNNISANAELVPLFSNKFILSGVMLSNVRINIVKDEKGNVNWTGATNSSKSKAGSMEISFNDIKLSNANIHYTDKKNNKKFNIPNINATINAQSLKGPYRINGKFIHNMSEILFNGDVSNGKDIGVRLSLNNAATASKLSIDGTVSGDVKGVATFETNNLFEISNIAFGKDTIPNKYNHPFFLSFQYAQGKEANKLDNFTLKYADNTAGSGVVEFIKGEKTNILANIDMIQFDLDILENIMTDITNYISSGKNFAETSLGNYEAEINIKSNNAWYKQTSAQNLILALSLKDSIIDINRLGLSLSGETNLKTTGKIALTPEFYYNINNNIETSDLKSFASIFNIDLAKYAKQDDKKSIFKNANANIVVEGNINNLKASIKNMIVDAIKIDGDLGFIFGENTNHLITYLNLSKVLFDKYIDFQPDHLTKSNLNDKLVYQFNLIPWKNKFDVEGGINIENGVYNDTAFNGLTLEFSNIQENIDVKKLEFKNIGGAELSLKANINDMYKKPIINELTYDIKTSNLPLFISSIGVKTNDLNLFKNKLFASQGVLSGNIDNLNMSTIQKFDNVEFTYTGIATQTDDNKTSIDGNIELKSNNFTSLVNDLNINYTPDIPVSNFLLSGNIVGQSDLFAIKNVNAYLGANNIKGDVQVDKTTDRTKFLATLDFESFNINRFFNIKNNKESNLAIKKDFIEKPVFSNNKIDYSKFSGIDFEINAKSKKVIYNKNTYTNASINALLVNNVLNIKNLDTKLGDADIKLDLILDTNNLAKVSGNFDIKNYITNDFCGSIYCIGSGTFSSKGKFDSIATSEEMFINNLNAEGQFDFDNTVITGWDMDIIKFEFEQRKNTDGFVDSIVSSLKAGSTNFDKIKGLFNIKKGIIIADNVSWESSVIDMNSSIELNIEKWDMKTNFDAIYKNATFTDTLKFKMNGNIASPTLEVDLVETIDRLAKYEQSLIEAKGNKEKKKLEVFNTKKESIIDNIKIALNDLNKMTLDIIRFKPLSNDQIVQSTYDANVKKLQNTENTLNKMMNSAETAASEKELLDIDSALAKELAGINFIPKTLEDNFIVDSKIIFDEIFNKLAWLYDVARNNVSYYNGLTEVYMMEIELLDKSATPVKQEKKDELNADIKKIAENMNVISELQSKIRDNYLNIIDTATIATMDNNNKVATQAVETMLTYVNQLNDNIVTSIDVFRDVLNINAKDYDAYLVYPPKSSNDIIPTSPTFKSGNVDNSKSEAVQSDAKADKISFSLEGIVNGLSGIFTKKEKINNSNSLDLVEFSGLSNLIPAKRENKIEKTIKTSTTTANIEEIEKQDNVESETIIAEAKDAETSEPETVVAEVKEVEASEPEIVVAEVKDVEASEPETVVAEVKEVEASEPEVVVAEVKNAETSEPEVIVAEVKEVEASEPEVVVAEAKDVENSEPEVVVAEAKDVETSEPAIKVAEAALDQNKKTHNSLLEKTKDFFKNFASKISDREEKTIVGALNNNIVDTIKKDVVNNIVEKNIIENTPNKTPSNMKINPVVAMNLGNNDKGNNFENIKNSIKEKKKNGGFKNTISREDIQSVKTIDDIEVESDTPNSNMVLASTQEIHQHHNKRLLKTLISYDDDFNINVKDASKEPPMYREDDEPAIIKTTENGNRYVFALKNNIVLSGDINKKILANKLNKPQNDVKKQYLFDTSTRKNYKTSGIIGKKIALSVK